MSAKTLLSSAFRQCKSCLSQQQASLSTSSKTQAFKRVQLPSSSSRILGLADSPSPRQDSTDLALKYAESDRGLFAQRKARQEETAKKLADQATSDSYMRMMPRRWKVGDVYAPRDLTPSEMRKWRRSKQPKVDVLDVLGVNPVDLYQNFSVISEYVTVMGRIKHSNETGLRPVNQRRMAKAIRRAIGLGIHPSVHRYPEIMKWVNSPFGVKSYAPKGSSTKSGS